MYKTYSGIGRTCYHQSSRKGRASQNVTYDSTSGMDVSLKKAFTLIELLVVIAIISLLVSILLPSLKKAQMLARRIVCASNLHTQAVATCMYLADNDDKFPCIEGIESGHSWHRLRFAGVVLYNGTVLDEQCGLYTIPLEPYVGSYNVFFCPDRETNRYPLNNGRTPENIWKTYITYNGFRVTENNSVDGVLPIQSMDNYRCWMYDILASDTDFATGQSVIGSHRNEGQNQSHPDGSVNWVDIDNDDAIRGVW